MSLKGSFFNALVHCIYDRLNKENLDGQTYRQASYFLLLLDFSVLFISYYIKGYFITQT